MYLCSKFSSNKCPTSISAPFLPLSIHSFSLSTLPQAKIPISIFSWQKNHAVLVQNTCLEYHNRCPTETYTPLIDIPLGQYINMVGGDLLFIDAQPRQSGRLHLLTTYSSVLPPFFLPTYHLSTTHQRNSTWPLMWHLVTKS